MTSDRLFQAAEKLYALEQAREQFGPAFGEAVEALAEDLANNIDHTMARWQRTLKKALDDPTAPALLRRVNEKS